MANATTMGNTPENLSFAKSESKAVGVLSLLRRLIPESIRTLCRKERELEAKNSARIIGGTKLIGDLTFGIFSTTNPILIGYAIFAVTGRLIMMTWGSKEHQKKLAEEKAAGKHKNLLGDSWRDNDRKILHPRLYPIEAAAGVQTVAEALGIVWGLTLGGLASITPVVIGAIAVYSYGQIVFKKDKKPEEETENNEKENEQAKTLTFDKSTNKSVGVASKRLRQAMKGNTVLVSSMINIGICIFGFIGGILTHNKPYIQAMPIFIFANLLQALMVHKNDYNIEGVETSKEGETKETPPATFQERVAGERSRDNDFGLQPA